MDQLSKELVTTADSSDTSWSTALKRMLKCSSFDPRKANKRDGRDRRGRKGSGKGSLGQGADGKQAVGRELRVQQVALGAEAKEAEWVSEERGTYWFDEAPQGPPMLAWSGSETRLRHKQPIRVGIRSLARGHCGLCMRPQRFVPVRLRNYLCKIDSNIWRKMTKENYLFQ